MAKEILCSHSVMYLANLLYLFDNIKENLIMFV